MKRGTSVAVGLLLVAVIGAAVGVFLYFYKQVEKEITLPATGEARYNPVFALRAALRAHGQQAETQRWLRVGEQLPGARDTLVMYGQAAPFTASESQRVLAWIRGGGRLVLRSDTVTASPALARGLGLAVEPGDFDCVNVQPSTPAPPKPAKKKGEDEEDDEDAFASRNTYLCGPAVKSAKDGVLLASPTGEGGHRYARVRLGAGEVVVVPSLLFLSNYNLKSAASTELAHQLLAPGFGRGAFLIVYGDDMPSLLRLIIQHGWMALVPALLALFAWLAYRGQRLGPLQPRAPGDRRALLEHVQAAGEFAFRRGRGRALHTALHERFERRLAQRDPVRAALQGDARVLALAERFGLPASKVRQALDPRDLHRPDIFLQSISTLAQMRLRL